MNLKKDAIFNTVGNFIYLGSMWLITVLAVRLADFESAGLLAIAMSMSNIFIAIASYSIRFYYASDIHKKYSDSQYILTRVITIAVSILICILSSLALRYSQKELAAIFLFYIYKCAEMASDMLYGTLQRHGYLYLCGYSLTIKSILTLFSFSFSLLLFKDINIALLIISLIAILILILYDLPLTVKKTNLSLKFNKIDIVKAFKLLKKCFPLFIVGLCYNMIPSIPRLSFERMYSTEELGYFSSLATITALISTAVGCVLLPIMPLFSAYFQERNKKRILGITFKCIFITFALGGIACIFAALFGDFVLEFLFGHEILSYTYIFIGLIVATTLLAMVSCLNNFFIAANKLGVLMVGAVFATVICAIISGIFCNLFYMQGIVFTLIISQGIEILYLILFVFLIVKNI